MMRMVGESHNDAFCMRSKLMKILEGFHCADPKGARGGGRIPGNSQVALEFLRNTGTDPLEKGGSPV